MIVVIKYNAGNIRSVMNALHRLNVDAILTDDPQQIRQADKVIFPGVGEAQSAMTYLRERQLDTVLRSLSQPFLGICLGLQLMCSYSEENDTIGLGIFEERVEKFPPLGKVPHIGWNNFTQLEGKLFRGLNKEQNVYFVHSFYAACGPDTIAITDYLVPFSAAMHRNNYYAVQFHPEKSATVGQQILKNFLELCE